MEIEYKYLIDDNAKVDAIFADDYVKSITDGKEEIIPMYAEYFDTEDMALSEGGIALRVRNEGGSCVATVKWDGAAEEGGLHRRNEVNVPVESAEDITDDLSALSQCEISGRIEELARGKKLVRLFSMDFVRRQVRIDTGRSISVMSVDQGRIITDRGEEPILELEIELFSGDEGDMRVVGEKISKEFGLLPGKKSKFARGKALFQQIV